MLTLAFVKQAWELFRLGEADVQDRTAKRLFGFSIVWLFALFALILSERLMALAAFPPVL